MYNHINKCEKCGKKADFIGVSSDTSMKYHCPYCYHITYNREDDKVKRYAGIAQSVEQRLCKANVVGSSPTIGLKRIISFFSNIMKNVSETCPICGYF